MFLIFSGQITKQSVIAQIPLESDLMCYHNGMFSTTLNQIPYALFYLIISRVNRKCKIIKFYHYTYLFDVFKEYTTIFNFKTGLSDNTYDFDAIHYFLGCW